MKLKEFLNFNNKQISTNAFYHSIAIYLRKPQVINRKLNTAKNILSFTCKYDILNILNDFFQVQGENIEITSLIIEQVLQKNQIDYRIVNFEDQLNHIDENINEMIIVLDKIIPRNIAKHKICYQLTIFNVKSNSVSFYAINDTCSILPKINYTIEFNENRLNLLIENLDDDSNWLQFVLLKKLYNWMESYSDDHSDKQITSHSLINDEEYSVLYAELKEKYGKKFEDIWDEEVTDPKKFIYEDLSIAAYLLSIWKYQRCMHNNCDQKQTFIDFGCGNGLLVAILTLEGHKGFGIDIRRRKIWSKFDQHIDLREGTWTPSDKLENVDWIIGNHSDELSPWVPVVASRNNISCNYFLLPCCSFEFSGAKYQRKCTSKSLYMSYIDYLLEISSICGFKAIKVDRLKIPSTKRICLIGMDRVYDATKFSEYDEKIQTFINTSNKTFIAREKQQAVRNCTKIDRNLADRIVKIIFDALLSTEGKQIENDWNCGIEMDLSDAVKLISADDLKKLKSENGGLQTLLRNHHQIFNVHSGKLKIRKPKRITERIFSKKIMLKSSICYFHKNHKQGCPLKDEECCFKHV